MADTYNLKKIQIQIQIYQIWICLNSNWNRLDWIKRDCYALAEVYTRQLAQKLKSFMFSLCALKIYNLIQLNNIVNLNYFTFLIYF